MSLVNGLARRVVIENQRATGVEIEARRQIQVVKARREVIVAASSINSPKLLMLSGIGPAAHLGEHGIDVVADRPGVGQNLQDHMELYIQQESLQPITLYSKLNLFSKALIGAEWLFFKTGLGATNHFEAAAFVRSSAGVDYPDIQYHFLPAAIRYDGKAAAKSHGFQAHVGPMRSKSRGSVTLRSADPAEQAGDPLQLHVASGRLGGFPPLHPADARDFRPGGLRPLSRHGRSRRAPMSRPTTSSTPSSASTPRAPTIRAAPAGWAAPTTAMSVVDPECRVIGVEGLRVADSSIFPRVTNGNLNAPSIMTGEKAADHILGTHAAGAVQPGALDQSALAGIRTAERARSCRTNRRRNRRMKAQPKASHYINGRFVDDEQGAPLPVIYPATGETIATLHAATPNIVELAVEAAREAQPAWARLKPVERGRILRRAADILRARNAELARLETLDTGKAIQETLVADAASAADALEFFGGAVAAFNGDYIDLGGPFAYTRREALGVCVGIGAWNYPIQGAGWKSAPALAMGNAMVFKPSENTPLSALALAEIYTEAGLPDGLFNVVQGFGDVGAALAGASGRRQGLADRLGADRQARCWRSPARR